MKSRIRTAIGDAVREWCHEFPEHGWGFPTVVPTWRIELRECWRRDRVQILTILGLLALVIIQAVTMRAFGII